MNIFMQILSASTHSRQTIAELKADYADQLSRFLALKAGDDEAGAANDLEKAARPLKVLQDFYIAAKELRNFGIDPSKLL